MAQYMFSAYSVEGAAHRRQAKKIREELWPDATHKGLPMLLPGGEIGRLSRFEHDETLGRWTYALEFRGSRP